MKETSRTVAGARSLLSKSLLVAQVAISLVLLIGSGLFLRTLGNLRRVDVGFDPMNLVLFRINPSINRYDQPRTASLFNELSERLKSLPGVRDVTVSNVALLSGSVNGTSMIVQGRSYTRGPNNINRVAVGANYFDLMKLPLVAGRVFTATDTQDAPPVAIINEAAARKFFPGEDPVGRRVGKTPEESGKMEIVGVIRDAKYNSLREPAPPTIYVPFYQNRLATANFTVRTAVDPASLMGSIRNVIRNLDPNIPSPTLTTQLDQIERRFEQERFIAQAYTLFGSLALFIASIGLFGVMSYNVARRTNEIGIRMALGAGRRDVVLMVMRESLILVFAGLLIGLGAAIAAGRLVTTLLFGLSATDPATIAGAAGAMMAVAVCAGYLPARRASRVDPMTALHYE